MELTAPCFWVSLFPFLCFQGVIAAFAASPIVFFYPAYFYYKSSKNAGDWAKVPIYEKGWLGIMIFVITPICFFVGLVSSVKGIADNWSGAGKPFACSVSSS